MNKNALLKAKILDATRRALLAQKINHVGTQTDAYATLLREKAIGVQKDLIRMVDKSEHTDGTITIRKDRPGGRMYLIEEFTFFLKFLICLYIFYMFLLSNTFIYCSHNHTDSWSDDRKYVI